MSFEERHVSVSLLRFSLRKLLLGIGLLSVLFAGMSALGGMSALALLLGAVVVAAHVLSTYVGTQLRDWSTANRAKEAAFPDGHHEETERECPPFSRGASDTRPMRPDTPLPSQLQQRGQAVARRVWLTGAGAVLGGLGGLGFAIGFFWPRIGWSAVIAGAVATAILGAWGAFLGGSFYGTARRAWREAAAGGGASARSRP